MRKVFTVLFILLLLSGPEVRNLADKDELPDITTSSEIDIG